MALVKRSNLREISHANVASNISRLIWTVILSRLVSLEAYTNKENSALKNHHITWNLPMQIWNRGAPRPIRLCQYYRSCTFYPWARNAQYHLLPNGIDGCLTGRGNFFWFFVSVFWERESRKQLDNWVKLPKAAFRDTGLHTTWPWSYALKSSLLLQSKRRTNPFLCTYFGRELWLVSTT